MFRIIEMKTRDQIDEMKEKEKKEVIQPSSTSNSNQYRDVHVYDTQCEQIQLPSYTNEEKINSVRHLQSLMRNGFAIQMLSIILNRNNYDPVNRIDSMDLLHWICTNPITLDLFYLLEEQIADNGSLGTCLMGSSHRFRQIYNAQREIKL